MKFVQIGPYDYINVDAIVYIDGKNRIVCTNDSGNNTYSLDKDYFNALVKEIL